MSEADKRFARQFLGKAQARSDGVSLICVSPSVDLPLQRLAQCCRVSFGVEFPRLSSTASHCHRAPGVWSSSISSSDNVGIRVIGNTALKVLEK